MVSKAVVGVAGEIKADENRSNFLSPGHAGVRRNEHANLPPGKATMESGQSMDRSDILHAIKKASWENDSSKDIESVSMTRLYKHQVGRGVG
jgi:hypothetical protein